MKERCEMMGAQMHRQLGQPERLSTRGDPRVGRYAKHARDAEQYLGLLLYRQRVAQMRVGKRARLINAARGME